MNTGEQKDIAYDTLRTARRIERQYLSAQGHRENGCAPLHLHEPIEAGGSNPPHLGLQPIESGGTVYQRHNRRAVPAEQSAIEVRLAQKVAQLRQQAVR